MKDDEIYKQKYLSILKNIYFFSVGKDLCYVNVSYYQKKKNLLTEFKPNRNNGQAKSQKNTTKAKHDICL